MNKTLKSENIKDFVFLINLKQLKQALIKFIG